MDDHYRTGYQKRYLPVEVNDQLYALPMESVVTVQNLKDAASTLDGQDGGSDSIPVYDLSQLLWQTPAHNSKYLIVLQHDMARGALLVDNIRPTLTASRIAPLPSLLEYYGCPVEGIIVEPLMLVLCLAGLLAQPAALAVTEAGSLGN